MMTARSGPRASTLSRQTAAIQNSERRIRHSSRSSWTSISDSTALATIPARAALGRYASRSVKKSITSAIVPAATRLGSWLRRARGIHRRRAGGAVAGDQRAGEAGRQVGRAVGEQHLVAVGLVAVLVAVAADHQQAFAQEDGHDRQGAGQQPQVVGQRDRGQGQRREARGDRVPSTPTPFAGRSNSATRTVSSTRATSAPGILGAYRFISRTIRKALTPIATE